MYAGEHFKRTMKSTYGEESKSTFNFPGLVFTRIKVHYRHRTLMHKTVVGNTGNCSNITDFLCKHVCAMVCASDKNTLIMCKKS
jgi:hypothetical protein